VRIPISRLLHHRSTPMLPSGSIDNSFPNPKFPTCRCRSRVPRRRAGSTFPISTLNGRWNTTMENRFHVIRLLTFSPLWRRANFAFFQTFQINTPHPATFGVRPVAHRQPDFVLPIVSWRRGCAVVVQPCEHGSTPTGTGDERPWQRHMMPCCLRDKAACRPKRGE
jgi:hypothetical protein